MSGSTTVSWSSVEPPPPDPVLVAKGELAQSIHAALAKFEQVTSHRVTDLVIHEMNVSSDRDVAQIHRTVNIITVAPELVLPWPPQT